MRTAMKTTGGRRCAVFLDRDGVIIEEVHYLRYSDQLRLLPGAARAIARLRRAGLKVIVVSNQSAVARGYLTLEDLKGIHRDLIELLRSRGTKLDAIYFCPHHPQVGRKIKCRCRKPATGMLEAAARRFGLNLKSCYLVGDTTTDIRTARNAGCCGVLVKTGKGGRDGCYKAKAHVICRDLNAAATWILKARNSRVV